MRAASPTIPTATRTRSTPLVSVLRVDRLEPGGERTPLGAFSTFADHGTVNPSEYQVYTQDHFGPATRLFEARMRRAGRVPKRSPVINVFANADEGDQSAGLDDEGPIAAERVGRAEGKAMFKAWLRAGKRAPASSAGRPALDADLLLRPADLRRPGRRLPGRRDSRS